VVEKSLRTTGLYSSNDSIVSFRQASEFHLNKRTQCLARTHTSTK